VQRYIFDPSMVSITIFKKMVRYSNEDDEKELSKILHNQQPGFCKIIDSISYDPRCFEVHRYCTLFCTIASEHAEGIIDSKFEGYIKIPEPYFDTMAHLIAQQNIAIGKRGITYPSRIKKYVLNTLNFDDEDNVWILIMIPTFLYTIETFYSKENPDTFFEYLSYSL
jgi:hypothetical protein